jgi:ATP-dependent Clp protease ATP-binding subunit ClpA
LAEVLGGNKELLIRIDCNTLQGSGFDSGPAINQLLGVPPGYLGYALGQGGLLSRIRDFPECVVLFDEFEKADPGVGKVLLQILDDGRVEDVDGNVLDFRRSYIVFTTNAGCTYDSPSSVGFMRGKQAMKFPTVETEAMFSQLRGIGLGEEFLGRIDYICLFSALGSSAIQRVIEMQLESLRRHAKEKGLEFDWEPRVIEKLGEQWKPRFGVRALHGILRNQVYTQLGIAESQGETEGVARVRLVAQDGLSPEASTSPCAVTRRREGDLLVIALA